MPLQLWTPEAPRAPSTCTCVWVQKLATREYADELVVLCVALEFDIRIRIIPYTPPGVIDKWAVSAYGREDAEHVLHLGNNDAHYVWVTWNSVPGSASAAEPSWNSVD